MSNRKVLQYPIPRQKILLNKKPDLVNKCRNQNKLLLNNIKRNDAMD